MLAILNPTEISLCLWVAARGIARAALNSKAEVLDRSHAVCSIAEYARIATLAADSINHAGMSPVTARRDRAGEVPGKSVGA